METPDGNELARIKGNIVHHAYDIIAPDKTVIAKVHLNWATIRDEYCLEIVKKDFNPLLILGYAIAMDHVKHEDRGSASSGVKVITKLFGH